MAEDPGVSKTILIVDDEESAWALYESILARDGYNIVKADDGRSVLRMLKEGSRQHFDLMVLDLMMPGFGGYDLLQEMQKGDYQKVPVFVITARSLDTETVQTFLNDLNVVEFWTKPFDADKFSRRVSDIVRLSKPQNT
jgi:DNA-binding response OmpR family regulator